MKSNCAQKYLETVAAGQFDINEANICCWRNNCSFCKATTKKDGVPQIDKAGLRFAAEMPGKGSIPSEHKEDGTRNISVCSTSPSA